MAVTPVLAVIEPMEWLTIGLVVFAGAQLWVQSRAEQVRVRERIEDRNEEIDRAFHLAWAEHFRLEGLADRLEKADLVEMTYLGILQPSDLLPRDWSKLIEAFSSMSREAGVLGGVALALAFDVQHAAAILTESVKAFARQAPKALSEPEKVAWLRTNFDKDLAPWEKAVRELVRELSLVMWDAAKHNPRATLVRSLTFDDDLSSKFGRAAVAAFVKRSEASTVEQTTETAT